MVLATSSVAQAAANEAEVVTDKKVSTLLKVKTMNCGDKKRVVGFSLRCGADLVTVVGVGRVPE